jgi:hypothetical protein
VAALFSFLVTYNKSAPYLPISHVGLRKHGIILSAIIILGRKYEYSHVAGEN